jgi:tetratricopeptide (TPR) repeat protein
MCTHGMSRPRDLRDAASAIVRRGFFVVVLAAIAAGGCASREAGPVPEPLSAEAGALLERAQQALDHGAFGYALALLDSVSVRAPAAPDVAFTRGLVLTKLRRFEEAENSFRSALELDPEYGGAWYHRGHVAFLQEQFRSALAHYRQEQRLLEKRASRRQSATAVDQFQEALPVVHLQIGRTLEQLGAADSARVAYETALALDSTVAAAHGWLSALYEARGDAGRSVEHAHKALELEPTNLEYAYRVGTLFLQQGELDEAASFLAAVVKHVPGHEGATYNLGRALMALGLEEEGQRYLDRVEIVHQLKNEVMRAEQAVGRYPAEPDRWIELARLMVQAGYLDKAAEAFSVALYLRPGDLSVQNDLANVSLAAGDTTGALYGFRSIVAQDSTFADGWFNLGVVYAMTGRMNSARAAWKEALRYEPGHREAKQYLQE